MTEWLRGNELEKRAAAAISAAPCGSAPIRRAATGQPRRRHLRRGTRHLGAPSPPLRGQHAYKDRLEQHGLRFSGMSPDGVLPEIVEYETIPGSSACSITPN
jgi:CTP synthase